MKKEFIKIGARIKALREEKGLTQPILASQVGCGQPYIADLESGRYKPGNSMLITLSNLFRVPVTDIDPDVDFDLKE